MSARLPINRHRLKPAQSLRPQLGLCCIFKQEPIKFYTVTATSLAKLPKKDAALKVSAICLSNARSLLQAFAYCAEHNIACFRVNSQILPVKTHPDAGYNVEALPDGKAIVDAFRVCGSFRETHGLRATFHPDQFILLSSPNDDVTERSIADLEYQAEVSEWIGADVINIHGGGGYGDKPAALARVAAGLKRLSGRVRSRLTLENDDKIYTPDDLLPFCREHDIPLVYDVHHHRCYPDKLPVEEATRQALTTWSRKPLFHISSPQNGWDGSQPARHHDYIDINDFPGCWRGLDITVEVEAKAKELAVEKLHKELLQS